MSRQGKAATFAALSRQKKNSQKEGFLFRAAFGVVAMKPFLRVSSSRVLHNAIANGSLVFFDCVPLGDEAAPPPPPSQVLDELIFDDRKRLVRVTLDRELSAAELSELATSAMVARHNAFVLGGEEKNVSRRLLEVLRSEDALRRVFSVPSELARAYFRRVPVLRAERFELPHEIVPGLFLGCYASAARSAEVLKALGITHVVNATGGFVNQFVGTFNYLDVDVQDSEEANIEEHFERVIEFVNEARAEGGSVLIHCGEHI